MGVPFLCVVKRIDRQGRLMHYIPLLKLCEVESYATCNA